MAGKEVSTYVKVDLPPGETPAERLQAAGLELSPADERSMVDFVQYGSAAEKAGLQFGWTVDAVQAPLDRPVKEWMFIPALILLGLLAWNQLRRRTDEDRGISAPQPA